MKQGSLIHRVYNFYREGFSSMDIGRVLWVVVLVKLFIIFIVLRIFFFPDTLKEKAGKGNEAEYVSGQIIQQL
ncbi:MAG: DUF4492 domain-containing protein [Prevotellaceae bacterium]|nr:DUF4492 domain-containing protein [Prevotellaceae bacterium]